MCPDFSSPAKRCRRMNPIAPSSLDRKPSPYTAPLPQESTLTADQHRIDTEPDPRPKIVHHSNSSTVPVYCLQFLRSKSYPAHTHTGQSDAFRLARQTGGCPAECRYELSDFPEIFPTGKSMFPELFYPARPLNSYLTGETPFVCAHTLP